MHAAGLQTVGLKAAGLQLAGLQDTAAGDAAAVVKGKVGVEEKNDSFSTISGFCTAENYKFN